MTAILSIARWVNCMISNFMKYKTMSSYDFCIEFISSSCIHYSNVIMSAIASKNTSASIVYSTVCWGPDQRKHKTPMSLALVTGEFPSQRASNAENVCIWWRHHVPSECCAHNIFYEMCPHFARGFNMSILPISVCSDITWSSWRLKTPTTQLFVQELAHTNNNENTNAPYCGSFVRRIHRSVATGDL